MIKRRLPSHPASRRIHATKAECARRIQPVQASRRHPTGRPELRSPPPDVPAEVSRAAAERELYAQGADADEHGVRIKR
jgi:hypothetical protein